MKVHVLLCDDASFIRDLIKRSLRKYLPQCEITEANDGKKAQSILNKQSFDLILSDWEMPIVSGEELLQWVRAHDKHGKTPFIMITSLGDKNHIVKAAQAGVSDYLGKPFTGEELLQKVKKALVKAGKLEAAQTGSRNSGAGAFSSAELLNPGKSDPSLSNTTDALTGSAKGRESNRIKGTAEMIGTSESFKCMVKSASLEDILLVMKKTAGHPQLLEKVRLDIAPAQSGERINNVQAYVHSLAASRKQADAEFFNVTLRLLENSPETTDEYSRFVLDSEAG